MQDIKADLKAIKLLCNDIGTKQAVHTEVLNRHERRSTNLEGRMLPIEKHVAMFSGVGKALIIAASIAGLILAVSRLL